MFIKGMSLLMLLKSPDSKGTEGGGDPAPAPEEKEKKPEPSNVELAKALKELKENSVSKEDYEKLKQENKELIAQVINGDGAGNGQTNPPEDLDGDIKALREKLYGPKCSELSNLEFCDASLKLREAVIKRDGIDPFVPRGANIKPTDYDAQRAQAVADVMAECIKEANGDSGVFTALLQAKTNNDSPALVAHLKKVGAIK